MTHLNAKLQAQMVDVSGKEPSTRTARAQGLVYLPDQAAQALGLKQSQDFPLGKHEIIGPKGPVFQTAIIAGIMAAKKTSSLIPLCHPLALDKVEIDIVVNEAGLIEIVACCKTQHKTGVEMEALTAVSVAALTIYDMCKALSHDIEIRSIRLLEKTGGKSDYGKH